MKAVNISHLRRIAHAMVQRDNRGAISLLGRMTGTRQSEKPKPETGFGGPPEGAIV